MPVNSKFFKVILRDLKTIRKDKVKALKAEIESGAYRINSATVAKALVGIKNK